MFAEVKAYKRICPNTITHINLKLLHILKRNDIKEQNKTNKELY